jgi:Skp family chaperone for outer membrane proteins
MKRYILTFFILFLVLGSSIAQTQESRFQQIEAAKVAYITKQLQLSPAEAQKFFPIYNQYRNEIRQISHEKRGTNTNFKRGQVNELEFDSQILACKKKYRERFATVIPPAKASRFFEVEREFRETLFKELENRNQSRGKR